MRMLEKHTDGGSESNVTGYWLIELKNLFSIVLLRFGPGCRENYHSHAFNALTWFLKGRVVEDRIYNDAKFTMNVFGPSLIPKYTARDNLHKVINHSREPVWALSFRGPWASTWFEYNEDNDETLVLTHGRNVVATKVGLPFTKDS